MSAMRTKLNRFCFAKYHGPCCPQNCHNRSILALLETLIDARIVLRWQIAGVDNVLDAQRYAMQWTQLGTDLLRGVEIPRCRYGLIGVNP